MLIDRTSRSLVLVLGEAHTTNPVTACAHYEDVSNENHVPITQITPSNGTTPVAIVNAPAANTARRLRDCYVCNNDTVAHNILVYVLDGAAVTYQAKLVLGVAQTLQFTMEKGWFIDPNLSPSYVGGPLSNPNKIINGGMVLDQRNAGATTTGLTYNLDRWEYSSSQSGKVTQGQDYGGATPPAGFSHYLGLKVTTTYALAVGDYNLMRQKIEGVNCADLNWGTPNAKAVTISFWVYASTAGLFGGSVKNNAGDRSYPFSYTINNANVWEQKTITLPGDTSGTWLKTTGIGLYLILGIGVGATFSGTAGAWAAANYFSATGATNLVGTANAIFYFTGVKLAAETIGTLYVEDDYAILRQKCQRYYNRWDAITGNNDVAGLAAGFAWATTHAQFAAIAHPVQMRGAPTFAVSAAADFSVAFSGGAAVALSAAGTVNTDTRGASLSAITTASASLTLGTGVVLCQHSNSAWYSNDAEL